MGKMPFINDLFYEPFFKDETGYSVVFPDLNWLATCGSNETEAMKMAFKKY